MSLSYLWQAVSSIWCCILALYWSKSAPRLAGTSESDHTGTASSRTRIPLEKLWSAKRFETRRAEGQVCKSLVVVRLCTFSTWSRTSRRCSTAMLAFQGRVRSSGTDWMRSSASTPSCSSPSPWAYHARAESPLQQSQWSYFRKLSI